MKPSNCPHDPKIYANTALGMYHCPLCGEMVLAGMDHPGIWEAIDEAEFIKYLQETKHDPGQDTDF